MSWRSPTGPASSSLTRMIRLLALAVAIAATCASTAAAGIRPAGGAASDYCGRNGPLCAALPPVTAPTGPPPPWAPAWGWHRRHP